MKLITHEKLLELVHYDPISGIFTARKAWKIKSEGEIIGSPHCEGYLQVTIEYEKYLLHRLAVFYMTGEWPKEDTDHKNRNRIDNRWENLREATRGQNMMNGSLRQDNSTGVKGVCKIKKTGKFEAYVIKDKVKMYLGSFCSIHEAYLMRQAVIYAVYGDFASKG